MTFALAGALILAVVALAAVSVGGRIYAPVPVYCGAWSGALAFYALAGQAFAPLYTLDETTVLFYTIGALVFAAGCAMASWRQPNNVNQLEVFTLRRSAVLIAFFLYVVTIPAAYLHVRSLLEGVPLDQLLFFARYVDVEASRTGTTSLLGPFANAVPFSIAVTLLVFTVSMPPRMRWMRSVIFIATLGIQLLTGGRSGIVALLIGVTGLLAMRGELKWRQLVSLGSVFFLLFFAVALLVKKGGTSLDASPSETARALLQGFRDYAVGGVVAFQRVLMYPAEVPSTGGITRTAALMLNGLGAHFPVSSPHAEFTTIGEGVSTNVYTAYFYYMEYGFVATFALVFISGFTIATVYARALKSNGIARAVYATFMAGMVLSVFGEAFYTNVNFLGKLLICGGLLLKRIQPLRLERTDVGLPA